MTLARVTREHTSRALAAALIAGLLASVCALVQTSSASAKDYPGQSQIDAAKAAVADATADVASLDAAIIELEQALAAAEDAAAMAADRYLEAQAASEEAQRQLVAASRRATDAQASLDAARADLAQIARDVYQNGGTFSSLEAVMTADGFEDVVARTEAYDRASTEADDTVQRVRAAELVAETMREYAETASQEAADAAQRASDALADAQDAQRHAESALAQAQSTREDAIALLAHMQHVSVELERERQAGLAQERLDRERAAFAAALKAAEDAAAGSGGSTSSPAATAPSPTTPAPAPTTPAPAPTTPAPTTPAPTTSTPSTPAPSPDPPTGGWRSTADQGQRAADYALSLMGTQYLLGGNGPAYDCSGVTYAAWRSVGITLPRSSRTQYPATTHIPLSQMRPGDLVFYGDDRDPNQIYHVAIYIGNGLVAEATKPGDVAKVRAYDASWRIGDLLPYAGRP